MQSILGLVPRRHASVPGATGDSVIQRRSHNWQSFTTINRRAGGRNQRDTFGAADATGRTSFSDLNTQGGRSGLRIDLFVERPIVVQIRNSHAAIAGGLLRSLVG